MLSAVDRRRRSFVRARTSTCRTIKSAETVIKSIIYRGGARRGARAFGAWERHRKTSMIKCYAETVNENRSSTEDRPERICPPQHTLARSPQRCSVRAQNKRRETRGNYLIGDQNLSLSHAISDTCIIVYRVHNIMRCWRRDSRSMGSHQRNERGDKRRRRHN